MLLALAVRSTAIRSPRRRCPRKANHVRPAARIPPRCASIGQPPARLATFAQPNAQAHTVRLPATMAGSAAPSPQGRRHSMASQSPTVRSRILAALSCHRRTMRTRPHPPARANFVPPQGHRDQIIAIALVAEHPRMAHPRIPAPDMPTPPNSSQRQNRVLPRDRVD